MGVGGGKGKLDEALIFLGFVGKGKGCQSNREW